MVHSTFMENDMIKKEDKIWLDSEKWVVKDIIKPNKYDCFLLVCRELDEIHEDLKTIALEYCCIDVNDNEFFPNTVEVRKILKKCPRCKRTARDKRKLTNIWINIANQLTGSD